jgi:hypothetical protein
MNTTATPQPELQKLLREQQDALDDRDTHPLCIERINQDVWKLRNKFACGSVWGNDPAFDKWWIKQVAKARNLNVLRKIMGAAAIASFFIWWIYTERCEQEYLRTHPDAEEIQTDES